MRTPINFGLLQSDIDFAGFKPLNADLSDYDLGGEGGGATHPVFTRFPADVLIKGAGVAMRPSDSVSGTYFGGMWGGGGQTYDESFLTNQLDILATIPGGNLASFFGDLTFLISGSLNVVTYLDRVDSVIDYADSLGLYVAFRGCHGYWMAGTTSGGIITSQARQLLKDTYNAVRVHDNVIAFDPITEASLWQPGTRRSVSDTLANARAGLSPSPRITEGQIASNIQTVYADLKGESTDIPISFTGLQADYTHAAMWLPTSLRTSVNACLDYLDFHCYYSPAFTEIVPVLSEASGRPVVISEFGSPTSSGGLLGAGCSYAEMLRIAEQLQIDGYVAWALVDQNTDPNDCWGMADNDGTLRAGRGTVFVDFPITPRTVPHPLYVGTDFRLVAVSGGAKIQVRNVGADTWADADQWTNP